MVGGGVGTGWFWGSPGWEPGDSPQGTLSVGTQGPAGGSWGALAAMPGGTTVAMAHGGTKAPSSTVNGSAWTRSTVLPPLSPTAQGTCGCNQPHRGPSHSVPRGGDMPQQCHRGEWQGLQQSWLLGPSAMAPPPPVPTSGACVRLSHRETEAQSRTRRMRRLAGTRGGSPHLLCHRGAGSGSARPWRCHLSSLVSTQGWRAHGDEAAP